MNGPVTTVVARRGLADDASPNGLSVVLRQVERWAAERGRRVRSVGVSTEPRPDTLRIGDALFHRFYRQTCCEALWPVLHGLPAGGTPDWAAVDEVAELLAHRLAATLEPSCDTVWLHDFHVLWAGPHLRRLGVDVRLGYFQHVPMHPVVAAGDREIAARFADALDAVDLVGVQTEPDRRAALQLGVDTDRVVVAPVATDPAPLVPGGASPGVEPAVPHALITGRADPTKGHAAALAALARLRRPVHAVLHVTPSRVGVRSSDAVVPELRRLLPPVETAMGRVGGTASLRVGALDLTTYRRLMERSSLLVIPSTGDGMNLVAKEFALLPGRRRIVLTPGVGARFSLPGAWVAASSRVGALATAIEEALAAPLDEVTARHRANREAVARESPTAWCESLHHALLGAPRRGSPVSGVTRRG